MCPVGVVTVGVQGAVKGEAKVASELLVFWFTGFGSHVKFSHPVAHFYVHKTVNTTHTFLFFSPL